MTVAQMALFLALLALLANLGALAGLVLLLRPGSPGVAHVRPQLGDGLPTLAMALALLVVAVATAGSLYFSEVARFVPCRLCWYQRIAMYPLVPIFTVAWLRRDLAVWTYALPIALIGLAVSTYHYLVEWYPSLEGAACSSDIPCSGVYVRELGFVSIPYMALSGFLAVVVACLTLRRGALVVSQSAPEEGT